jgi:hypothetical protein
MKKNAAVRLAILLFTVSAIMYLVGNRSANLSELRDFWWIPLLPAVLLYMIARFKKTS